MLFSEFSGFDCIFRIGIFHPLECVPVGRKHKKNNRSKLSKLVRLFFIYSKSENISDFECAGCVPQSGYLLYRSRVHKVILSEQIYFAHQYNQISQGLIVYHDSISFSSAIISLSLPFFIDILQYSSKILYAPSLQKPPQRQ